MLSQKYFQGLRDKHAAYAKMRSEIIHESQDNLRNAKRAIFALHRDEVEEAEKLIKDIEAGLKKLRGSFKDEPKMAYEGAYLAALEEYVEARLLLHYSKTKEVEAIDEEWIRLDTYLAGLSDFTGELSRQAVMFATKGKNKEVSEIKDAVEEVITELLKFDLTSYLRTKFDQAKNNLRKLEDIMYQISMKK